MDELLSKLVERGELIELRGSHYVVTSMSREFTVGRLTMHRDGFGFVVPEKPVPLMEGDLFIPPEKSERAMHGDRVIARIVRFNDNGRAEGEIVRILKRAHMTVVGEFLVKRRGCFVKPHDDRIQQWIEVPEGMEIPESRETVHRVGVEPVRIHAVEDLDGMIVNVEILDYPESGDNPTGRVIEVLGRPDDFGIDVEIVTPTGLTIVAELKTTKPYQPGFGAAQKANIKKDMERLAITEADHRIMFVTDPNAFSTLCSPSYRERYPAVEIVNVLTGDSSQSVS